MGFNELNIESDTSSSNKEARHLQDVDVASSADVSLRDVDAVENELKSLSDSNSVTDESRPDMKSQTVWLSYDLGLDGDYETLYYWLDSHQARECGDGIAFFEFEFEENLEYEIRKELARKVDIRDKDRLYLIFKDGEDLRGMFIYGHRKVPTWKGYAGIPGEDVVIDTT